MACSSRTVYVGSRTTTARNARGHGLMTFVIGSDGEWTPVAVWSGLANPSFLTRDRSGRFLYAGHGDGSAVSVFSLEPDGVPRHLQTTSCVGLNPVHLIVTDDNRTLIVVNHLTASVVALPRNDDGTLGAVSGYHQIVDAPGPHRTEQNGPKPHQAVQSADGTRLYVPNKGSDSVHVLGYDRETGAILEQPLQRIALREGSGPRNMVLHPNGELAVLACELDSTAVVLRIDGDGAMEPVFVTSTLPQEFFGHSRAGWIALSTDGTEVFISNRGHDSVTAFHIDVEGATLKSRRWIETGGRTPRFFAVDPKDGRLTIANEDSDTIATVALDEGSAARTRPCRSATCIVFGDEWERDIA